MIKQNIENLLGITTRQGTFMAMPFHRFLMKVGVEKQGSKRPRGFRKMTTGMCFRNATRMSWERGLTYVEGLAHTADVPFLVHHAWNETADGQVVDVTWKDPQKCWYMGVVVPGPDLNKALRENGVYGVFCPKDMYDMDLMFRMSPEFASEFNELLARRGHSRLLA